MRTNSWIDFFENLLINSDMEDFSPITLIELPSFSSDDGR